VERVRALPSGHKSKNSGAAGFWKRGEGGVAQRVVNSTNGCTGPSLAVYSATPPTPTKPWELPPDAWVENGFIHFVVAKNTLVPAVTIGHRLRGGAGTKHCQKNQRQKNHHEDDCSADIGGSEDSTVCSIYSYSSDSPDDFGSDEAMAPGEVAVVSAVAPTGQPTAASGGDGGAAEAVFDIEEVINAVSAATGLCLASNVPLTRRLDDAIAFASAEATKRMRTAPAAPLPPLARQASLDKLFMDLPDLVKLPDPTTESCNIWRSAMNLSSECERQEEDDAHRTHTLQSTSPLARPVGAVAHSDHTSVSDEEKKDAERRTRPHDTAPSCRCSSWRLQAALTAASAEVKASVLTSDKLVAAARGSPEHELILLLKHAPPESVSLACASSARIQRCGQELGLVNGSFAQVPLSKNTSRPTLDTVLDDCGSVLCKLRSSNSYRNRLTVCLAVLVTVGVISRSASCRR